MDEPEIGRRTSGSASAAAAAGAAAPPPPPEGIAISVMLSLVLMLERVVTREKMGIEDEVGRGWMNKRRAQGERKGSVSDSKSAGP